MSCVKLELITDPDLHLFIEKGLRGRISIISNRYSKANNKYMGDDYIPNKKSKFIMYLEANNVYGWSMTQYLPTGKFKFISAKNFDVSKVKMINIGIYKK